jgi:hypothetical protein
MSDRDKSRDTGSHRIKKVPTQDGGRRIEEGSLVRRGPSNVRDSTPVPDKSPEKKND